MEVFGLGIADLGATGLLVVVAALLYFGKLVPASVLNKGLTFREKIIDRQQETIAELARQNAELLASAKITAAVLEALPQMRRQDSEPGGEPR